MENTIQLTSYRIDQIDFKFNSLIKPGTKFQINPKIECKVGRKDKTLLVNLSARVNEDISSPVPFNLNAVMFATFNIKEEADQSVYAKEAMDALYPFLRSAVATITVNCNIPAYVLPVISASQATPKSGNDQGNLN